MEKDFKRRGIASFLSATDGQAQPRREAPEPPQAQALTEVRPGVYKDAAGRVYELVKPKRDRRVQSLISSRLWDRIRGISIRESGKGERVSCNDIVNEALEIYVSLYERGKVDEYAGLYSYTDTDTNIHINTNIYDDDDLPEPIEDEDFTLPEGY